MTAFISVKVIAILVGTKGMVMLGQLNNFNTVVFAMASGGILSGVTKHVSEQKEEQNINDYILTGAQIILLFTIICALVLIFGASFWSRKVFLSNDFEYVFVLLGLNLFFYSTNAFLTAVMNGFKAFRLFTIANIANSIIGLLFSLILLYFWQLKGVLIGAVTFQSISCLFTISLVSSKKWLNRNGFFSRINWIITRKYFLFSLMALTSAATLPIAQMIIRTDIVKHISLDSAGWWDALNRLSGVYLLIITTAFSAYYLPRLSEIREAGEMKAELRMAYKYIIPILALGLGAIFFTKHIIIKLLFSPVFQPMEQLFSYQLIGDFFKMSSWVIAFLMITKTQFRIFIFSEIFFSLSLVLLNHYFMKNYGINGTSFAYMVNYIMYFMFMCGWVLYFFRHRKHEI